MSAWSILVTLIFLVAGLRFMRSASLSLLLSAIQTHSQLQTSTTTFGVPEQLVIVWLLLVKYLLRLLGLIKPPKAREGGKMELPESSIKSTLTITQPQIDLMSDALSAARGNQEEQVDGEMMLTALTTPYLLLLFSKVKCPVFPIGSVNTSNKFEYSNLYKSHFATLVGQSLRIVARMGGNNILARRVKRGMELDAIIEVYLPPSEESSGGLLFRQTISILQFMSRSAAPAVPSAAPTTENDAGPASETKMFEKGVIAVEKADPWKWAAVCGDYNPIHISGILAKSFGFASQIAHGNHVIALANAKVGYRVSGDGETVVVRFLRPCVLPARVDVRASPDGTKVEIWKGEKLAMTIDRKKGINL